MIYRLLVDFDVVRVLDCQSSKIRTQLIKQFEKIRETPDRFSDFHEYDRVGRQVEISLCAGFAIHYWIDFADRHVKILLLKRAPS